mmetsp:Transcript_21286/g.50234  ORF Transcript_21286/g.50234 Transcript_21286/m.50234 type:complete len:270 (+) Transcript_21286:127-936(+)
MSSINCRASNHHTRSCLFGSSKSLLGNIPVHNFPHGIDVIRPDVAIIDVVGMLPHINAKKWDKASSGLERVLIGTGGNFQTAGLGVEAQPSPSASLNGNGGRRHLLLHLLHTTKRLVDGGLKGAAGLNRAGALRRQVLPEQGVVEVASAVEFERSLQSDDGRNVTGRCDGIELLQSSVEVGHVRVVVLGVVQSHGLGANDGLEGIVVVRKVGKRVGTAGGGGGEVCSSSLGHLLWHGGGAQIRSGTKSRVDELTSGGHDGGLGRWKYYQ